MAKGRSTRGARLALLAAIAAAAGVALLAGRLWPAAPLREGVPLSRAVFDRDGALLRLTLASDEKYRLWVPLRQMAPGFVEATLLHEDQHFYFHPGVNVAALLRGAWTTYVGAGRRVGGSTVSMQLARRLYGIDSRTPVGKATQVAYALWLEYRYSKRAILEAYLNLAPYGRNIEGVGAASLVYFGKEAAKLSLSEALTLAVIPQSPVRRGPGRGNERLAQARGRLFERWLMVHPEHHDQKPAFAAPVTMRTRAQLPFLAPHFVEAVAPRIPSGASEKTTLDLRLQRLLERHVAAFVRRRQAQGIKNAAAMLVDWRSAEVRAVVGSADYRNVAIEGQVNGTRAKRSPGSALKPFVYGLAYDQGLIHPLTMVKDTPSSFGGYNPENFDGDFAGPLSAREALIRSRNIPAVQLAARLSDPSFHAFLKRASISRLRSEENYGLSLVLGAAEVTMEELVELYAMLARGGTLARLRTIGADAARDEEAPRLLSAGAAYLTLASIESPRIGMPAIRASYVRDPLRVAWKTGTSNGHRDAWSVGVFGPYVLAIWIGHFDGRPNRAFVGADAAAPLMFEMIDSLRADEPLLGRASVRPPKTVSRIEVCELSGQMPTHSCRRRAQTWFIPGKSPVKPCEIHREVKIDLRTGKRTCRRSDSTFVRTEVYEFWPTDLLRLFRKAGIPRRTPPPEAEDCRLEAVAEAGAAPSITSPQRGVEYAVRLTAESAQTIPLLATADADAREMFWFIDDRLVGKARPGEALPWRARPGRYVVRAVDDRGRADTAELKVRAVQ